MKVTFKNRMHGNLVQRIRSAESAEEIDAYLTLGVAYESASDKTRSRWHEAAKIRRRELEGAL